MKPITENEIELFAIEQLQSLGWDNIHYLAIPLQISKMVNMLNSKLMSWEVMVEI
ncbi:MAG: hypothetical protein KF816_17265 [Melioribacteraceae bacterium]|nr:hypothetical protein [Melioribacteraceae bacterium]